MNTAQEHSNMKIRELINFLTSVDDPETDVVVAYFQTSGIIAALFDIEEVEASDGTARLKIYEVE